MIKRILAIMILAIIVRKFNRKRFVYVYASLIR